MRKDEEETRGGRRETEGERGMEDNERVLWKVRGKEGHVQTDAGKETEERRKRR